jgi:predicted flap endonuclease-1-like 5' DNA nuclease
VVAGNKTTIADLTRQVTERDQRVEQLGGEVKRYEQVVAGNKTSIADLTRQVTERDAQVQQLGGEIKRYEQTVSGHQATIADLTHQLSVYTAQAEEDDLTVINGIGRVFAEKLRAAGIKRFQQIATSTPENLAAFVDAPEWRKPDFAGWIAQAAELANRPT